MRQVLMIAAFDSQLKWCARVRTAFEAAGFRCSVVVPDLRSALSDQQIADAGFDGVEHVTWESLVESAVRHDVVVSALSGPSTKRLSIDLSERSVPGRPTPVLVSGWVGVIIEKIVAGYLDRCGLDVVAVNSSQDRTIFVDAAAKLGLPAANLLLTGLPFLSGRPQVREPGPIKRVLFADQPTVPGPRAERAYVYRQLVQYAVDHPDREVRLKPRHRLDEDTFHRMKYHPEVVLEGVPTPSNFMIDYTPVSEALPSTDLLLTVSSTACLEAIDQGCQVALVLDLGVHERHGNHVFIDSGLLRTFAQIGRDEIGPPDPEWRDGYFLDFAEGSTAADRIVSRVTELLASGERPSQQVWATDYFASTVALQRAIDAEPPLPPKGHPLARRIERHGTAVGLAAHLSSVVLPVRVRASLRRAVKGVEPLRSSRISRPA